MHNFKFIIKGTVQKVYYRKTICDNAKKHNFNGYVKNLTNGNVEVAVSCKNEELKIFIEILQKGSIKSNVTHIEQFKCNEVFSQGFITI